MYMEHAMLTLCQNEGPVANAEGTGAAADTVARGPETAWPHWRIVQIVQ